MPDIYQEEILRRELNRLDFNKLEAQALTELVTQSAEHSKILKEENTKQRSNAKQILQLMNSKNLLKKLDLTKEDLQPYANVFTDAVDGSMQKYPKPDGSWLYFFSVARIRYTHGYNSDVEVKVTPQIKSIGQIVPEAAASEAEEFMFNLETEALKVAIESRNVNDKGIVFLDGPIIDPPLSSSQSYIQRRTFAIKEAFNKNIMVIGIVKRILGTLFINHYRSFFTSDESVKFENMNSDKNLAVHVLTDYLRTDKGMIAFTEPIIMSEANPSGSFIGKKGNELAKKYHDEGVDVVTFLMANGYTTNPIRVDFAVSDANKIDKIELCKTVIKHIVRWAAPGRHLPIPVILAHEKCNIGQGTAEILFTEFITGSKSNDEDENIIQMKMMGDIH